MIERVERVVLEVADLERSVTFYRDGLRFAGDISDESRAEAAFRAGDVNLTVVQQPSRPQRRRPLGVELVVQVRGVDAYYEALVGRGLLPSTPHDSRYGRSFSIVDPDGYRWTFVDLGG